MVNQAKEEARERRRERNLEKGEKLRKELKWFKDKKKDSIFN